MAIDQFINEDKRAVYWISRYTECARLVGALLCKENRVSISSIKFVYLLVLVESFFISNISLRQRLRRFSPESVFFNANKVFRDRGEDAKYVFHALDLLVANGLLQHKNGEILINARDSWYTSPEHEVVDRYKLRDTIVYVAEMSDKQFAKEVVSHDPY